MQQRHSNRLRNATLAILLTTTTLGGMAAVSVVRAETAIQPTPLAQRLPDFSQLVQQVKPAVVSITVHLNAQAEQTAMTGDLPDNAPFGSTEPQQGHSVGKGSGFIIDANGIIVTNNHVVQHASTVDVRLDDGTTLRAHVIGRDPATDVAVVKVDAGHPLPFLALGDSSKVQPGEWVIAVGNPYGLSGSVTAGIVSARGRDIGSGPYDSFIQVDAPINRGNSGGPLLTQDGKVIGVNTAIFSPSGGSIGIGFAIPSDMVRQVADQIVKTGHVTRGYLGVSVQPVSKAMARAMRLPDAATTGALVAGVIPDGPAAHAGIQPGDVILAVGPTKITDPRSLAQTAAAIAPGTTTKLDVLHDGAEHMVAVDIGTQQSADAGAQAAQHSQTGPALGLSLAPLTPDLRDQLGLGNAVKGAVIAAVRPNSPADQAGLQTGDVLLGVNGHPVASPKAAASALRDSGNADRPLALHILRDGQAAFIAIDPTQQPDNSEG